ASWGRGPRSGSGCRGPRGTPCDRRRPRADSPAAGPDPPLVPSPPPSVTSLLQHRDRPYALPDYSSGMVQSKVIWRALPALVSVVLVPFRLEAQTVQAGPVEFRFGGRIQMQFSTTSLDRSDIPGGGSVDPADLEIRRLRASVEARLGDRLKGKVEPDFTSRDATLRDAWVDVAFADGFALRAGQFKKPFSRLESTSSVLIVPIERGVRIRGLRSALEAATEPVTGRPLFGEAGGSPVLGDGYALLDGLGYLGRDVGLAAHGRLGRVAYEVGVFNGRGTSVRPGQEGLAAAGRLVVRPAPGLPLSIGAGASYRKSRFDDTDALRRRGGAA